MYKKIIVSWKYMKNKMPCNLSYITANCKGRCCSGQSVIIPLLPEETSNFTNYTVINNLLQPKTIGKNNYVCHFFDNTTGLCTIQNTIKPLACRLSPLKINKNDKLVIQWRWLKLKCFGEGDYIYKTYKYVLDYMFGVTETNRICKELDNTDKDVIAYMSEDIHKKIKYLDSLHKK